MAIALRADSHQMDALAQALGRIIETERKRLGLTQEDVAEQLGVSQNAVTGWERAARHGALNLGTIISLEQLFKLPRGTILQRLGMMPAAPDVEAVILNHALLKPEQKEALISVYRAMLVPVSVDGNA